MLLQIFYAWIVISTCDAFLRSHKFLFCVSFNLTAISGDAGKWIQLENGNIVWVLGYGQGIWVSIANAKWAKETLIVFYAYLGT